MPLPLVIAHRGDSSATLENSLESMRRALSLSVDMIELDIRMSRDKIDVSPLVSHELPLSGFRHGIELIEQGKEGVLKVLMRPDQAG